MSIWALCTILAIGLFTFLAFRGYPSKTGWVNRTDNPARYWLVIAVLATCLIVMLVIAVIGSFHH